MEENKINILNLHFSKGTLDEILIDAAEAVERKEQFYVCAPNAFVTVKANEDKELLEIINNARIVIPDGMSSVWVSRRFKKYNLERISGYDFFYEFSKIADKKGFSYFFLGGKNLEILIKIKDRLGSEFRNIDVKGYFSPPLYHDKMPEDANKKIIGIINDCRPDVLWVGLSSPKQEKWIFENIKKTDIKMACAVGAVFNFYSGEIKRAPVWMQKKSLEWLYRMLSEPKRLFIKYLVYNTKFIVLVLKDLLKGNIGLK
jgi:N-acetylglucosaminyldiphosphoundecaprenol N-acetyl-beta-D-mannosaminyltransferase